MENRKYYEAYDERYKTVHEKSIRWFGDEPSKIVLNTVSRFNLNQTMQMLEIGCGEGRDAQVLLKDGYDLLATDVSPEAIAYCRALYPSFQENFQVLDCLTDLLPDKYDFIYAVAVIHMLVLDEDRKAFYRFIYQHLKQDGISLICTMGDGQMERQTDISTAFELQEKNHEGETLFVAGTSCKMVSFENFEKELSENNLEILDKGSTSIPSVFPHMMYAVVKRKS